jgi:hypothetical protein
MKIAVFNCDKYWDVNKAWLDLYRKFWSEQPYEVVYVTNKRQIDVDAEVVYIERDELDYGGRLLAFLHHHYEDELVLLVMADYLLKSRVKHDLVMRAEKLCRRKNTSHCRLAPMPRPQKKYKEKGFGRIQKGKRYSLSLQPGIWKTSILKQLVQYGDNPWQIEVRRSRQTHKVKGLFLSTEQYVMPHQNYYRKGKPQAIEWAAKHVSKDAWPKAVRRVYGAQ